MSFGATMRRRGGYVTPPEADPYWSSVAWLLPMSGSDGSTSFPDVKGNTSLTIGSAVVASNKMSVSEDTGRARITKTYAMAGKTWTLDGFISFPSFGSGNIGGLIRGVVGMDASDISGVFIFYSVEMPGSSPGASWTGRLRAGDPGTPLDVNLTWVYGMTYHIEVSFDGTTLRVFRDGTLVSSRAAALSGTSVAYWRVGCPNSNPGYYRPALLDDHRFTDGVVRHTSAFTPPTAPFPIA